MTDLRFVAETKETSITVPLDQLGAAGAPGRLVVVPIFDPPRHTEHAHLLDHSPRPFAVLARLSKSLSVDQNLAAGFHKNDGDSFIQLPDGASHWELQVGGLKIRLDVNECQMASMASCNIMAPQPEAALDTFYKALTSCVDHISYIGQVPVHIALVVVRDSKYEVQTLFYTSPPRSVTLAGTMQTLNEELAPVYALYREATNATSPYYRVLCFSKILEGLLGVLRTRLNKRAATVGLYLKAEKLVVPEHPDIANNLKPHCGTGMKKFYDNFLSKRFRDAMAHFELRQSNAALNVSEFADNMRFQEVAFLADLCVRVAIARHEKDIDKLKGEAASPAPLGGGSLPRRPG